MYLHDDSLFGLRFDARTLKVGATPVRLVEGLVGTGGGQFVVSASGTLIYQAVETPSPRTLVRVDNGGAASSPWKSALAGYLDPRISPDGTRVAVSLSADIWIALLAKPVFQRLTFTALAEHTDLGPGRRLCDFDSRDDECRVQITRKLADGNGHAGHGGAGSRRLSEHRRGPTTNCSSITPPGSARSRCCGPGRRPPSR